MNRRLRRLIKIRVGALQTTCVVYAVARVLVTRRVLNVERVMNVTMKMQNVWHASPDSSNLASPMIRRASHVLPAPGPRLGRLIAHSARPAPGPRLGRPAVQLVLQERRLLEQIPYTPFIPSTPIPCVRVLIQTVCVAGQKTHPEKHGARAKAICRHMTRRRGRPVRISGIVSSTTCATDAPARALIKARALADRRTICAFFD